MQLMPGRLSRSIRKRENEMRIHSDCSLYCKVFAGIWQAQPDLPAVDPDIKLKFQSGVQFKECWKTVPMDNSHRK